MTVHGVRLLGREEVAAGTMAFHFEKPSGFVFKPGQAVDLVLPGAGEERRHAFSLASAPYEGRLTIATRMRDSAYKRALGAWPLGGSVVMEGPFGSLTLHKDPGRSGVFIAGGIGITPFMSILRQAARDALAQPLALLYSNRRPEDAAFLADLQRLEAENPRFRLVATMTDIAQSTRPWQGERRRVDASLVAATASGLPSPVYYLAGPPAMVAGVQEILAGAGIHDDDIRSEEFYGY